ncbi:MAG: YdcF family protein, partial [Verrucomicrobiota bacterium]|nr:YdcF family protein [Verrucomicrobiota bacterium]
LILLGLITWFCLENAYSFLAITERVPQARTLIVEGWVPLFTIREAAREFAAGHYDQIYTTGGPITGEGGYSNEFNTSANAGAGRLRVAGVPADAVQMVPSRVNGRDRTYASAVALRDWLREKGRQVDKFDVMTENTHARRSQMLFQKAFGSKVKVGIIAVENPDYDAGRWWESSEGVKNVAAEAIGYIYSKLFFWPPKGPSN